MYRLAMTRICSHCQHHFAEAHYVCPNCGSECFENGELANALNLTESDGYSRFPRLLIPLLLLVLITVLIKWILL